MSSEDYTKIKLQTNVKADSDPTLIHMRGTTNHKGIDFDVPFMTQIDTNLWQGGCQKGLQLPHFIKHVVSLYKWEAYQIKHDIDSFLVVTMFDSLNQATDQVEALAKWVNVCRKTGPVLVHCQAGLNRSSLITGRALMLEGLNAKEVTNILRTKRSPACLSNSTFEEYLESMNGVY